MIYDILVLIATIILAILTIVLAIYVLISDKGRRIIVDDNFHNRQHFGKRQRLPIWDNKQWKWNRRRSNIEKFGSIERRWRAGQL